MKPPLKASIVRAVKIRIRALPLTVISPYYINQPIYAQTFLGGMSADSESFQQIEYQLVDGVGRIVWNREIQVGRPNVARCAAR